jgi:small subunit ribosomal protein S13
MPVMVDQEKKGKKAVKKAKKEAKPESQGKGKSEEVDENFIHLVRLSGVVVDGHLTIPKALMRIKGVGPRIAGAFIQQTGHDPKAKIGTLNESQIAEIEGKIEKIGESLPEWMLNRRKDHDTGANIHRLGPELDMSLREDINREKKIRSYKGVRHQLNLPVRGQRTRSSFRKNTTIGVSRKRGK